MHLQIPHLSHIHIGHAHKWCARLLCDNVTSELRFYKWRGTMIKNRSVHVVPWTTSTKLFTLDVTSEGPHHGGYAGVRLGEAHSITQEQPITKETAARTRRQTVADDAQFSETYPSHQRAFLRCGADPLACTGHADSGLMIHMSQTHRGHGTRKCSPHATA